jgi:flagellar hook protein FlgE
MLGAIFVGLSGMQAFSKGLKTISTNVANLDTLGYKSSTVSFSDMFGEHANGLSYTSGQAGSSTGNGVHYNKEQIDFGQGSFQQTGNGLDLAIEGNGFLVVRNKDGQTFYTRTGQFSVDDDGYITTQNGDRLTILKGGGEPQVVNTHDYLADDATATDSVVLNGEITSATTTTISTPDIKVYDSTGALHTWRIDVSRTATTFTDNKVEWRVKVFEKVAQTSTTPATEVEVSPDVTKTILFDTTNGDAIGGSSKVEIVTTPPNSSEMKVVLDFSKVRGPSTGSNLLQIKSSNGHIGGTLTTVTVNAKGELVLTYSNQETEILGAVAIADFQDLQDLTRVGSGLFTDNGNSQLLYKSSGADGVGKVLTGQVEASNVDLTAEFGNLILIQRGFDASSQVISATNDMIQALFGMRGRG